MVQDLSYNLCESLVENIGGVASIGKKTPPTPVTYLTNWKIVGNSEVHGQEIWSCGEYNPTDGKYHILVQPQGGSIADIALDEPLRKVNDVADTIEFPSGTEGKALVTRNLGGDKLKNFTWNAAKTNINSLIRWNTKSLKNVIRASSVILTIEYTKGNTWNRADKTYSYDSNDFFIYDKDYNTEDSYNDFIAHINNYDIIYELATPTTELVDAPPIAEAESYTCEISQGGKAVEWSEFITDKEELCAYGVQWDKNDNNPDVTRIGNMALHASLPVQSLMRGCLLNDDGEVVKYLNANDWTSETRDGSQGQVMVEIPHFYWKFAEDVNGIQSVKLSLQPLNGYKEVWHSPIYVSAYQAALDRTNLKLASVVNTTAQYRGGNNTSSWDEDSQKTLLGRPVTNISLTNFRTYARKRKANSTEWNCNTYLIQKVLYWLFVVEYATLNSQKSFDNTLTAEGYKKGGLGAGVTNANDTTWHSYSSRNPFVPCGYTDSLGNGTGQASIVMPLGANGADVTIYVPRYRGIENPFGHVWQWTDGVLVNVQSGDDGESQCYVTTNPSDFSSSSYSDYTYIGNEPRTNNYIKDVLFGTDGDILAKTNQTNSPSPAKYYCDYHYVNIPTSTALRGFLFGGASANGSSAGLVCSRSIAGPTAADAGFGSRLNFLPATE